MYLGIIYFKSKYLFAFYLKKWNVYLEKQMVLA